MKVSTCLEPSDIIFTTVVCFTFFPPSIDIFSLLFSETTVKPFSLASSCSLFIDHFDWYSDSGITLVSTVVSTVDLALPCWYFDFVWVWGWVSGCALLLPTDSEIQADDKKRFLIHPIDATSYPIYYLNNLREKTGENYSSRNM